MPLSVRAADVRMGQWRDSSGFSTMTPVSDNLRTSVLLSFMRALWQHVLPELRGVTMRLTSEPDQEPQVRSRFLYEGAVEELQQDCVWEAEGELMADFPEG